MSLCFSDPQLTCNRQSNDGVKKICLNEVYFVNLHEFRFVVAMRLHMTR